MHEGKYIGVESLDNLSVHFLFVLLSRILTSCILSGEPWAGGQGVQVPLPQKITNG